MARTSLPLAASMIFALAGLPAAAAEVGDESASADTTGAEATVDQAAPASDTETAARRGGGNKGGKGKGQAARSGGQRGSKGQSGGKGQAARGSGQGQPSGALPGGSRVSQPAQGARGQAPQASAQRGQQGSQASNQRGQQGSQASRPSSNNSASAQRGGRLPNRDHSSNATQAGNGPRAANSVEAHRRNDGANRHQRPAGKPGNNGRPSSKPNRGNSHKHVVHHSTYRPSRWAPSWHRYHLTGVPHYSPRYWAAGIFYYNPPPRGHRVVVVDDRGRTVKGATGPSRAVNRNNSVNVGIQGGSYLSGYRDGGGYGDLGLGLNLGYRPVEAVGLELSWMHHSDTWDDHAERAQDPISASVELFAFPWTRVSPYLQVGLTATPREARDTYFNGIENVTYEANDALFGPHLGAGIEFAVGQSAAIDFSGKYIGYIDVQDGDTAVPGAFQGNMGLNFYF